MLYGRQSITARTHSIIFVDSVDSIGRRISRDAVGTAATTITPQGVLGDTMVLSVVICKVAPADDVVKTDGGRGRGNCRDGTTSSDVGISLPFAPSAMGKDLILAPEGRC